MSDADGFVLSNAQLAAHIDRAGHVRSLVHLPTGRETMAAPGARFLLLEDRPLDFEAWDIDPFALETAREVTGEVHPRGACWTADCAAKFASRAEARSRQPSVPGNPPRCRRRSSCVRNHGRLAGAQDGAEGDVSRRRSRAACDL